MIGDAWIELALRAARAPDPDAELFYNETRADIPNSKFGAVEAMAGDFVARGVPLDGIGRSGRLGRSRRFGAAAGHVRHLWCAFRNRDGASPRPTRPATA